LDSSYINIIFVCLLAQLWSFMIAGFMSCMYTWGLGNMGQLGHTSLQSGEKELLPRRVVALDGIFSNDVACAVTQKGALYAWGGGQAGQLGPGLSNLDLFHSFLVNQNPFCETSLLWLSQLMCNLLLVDILTHLFLRGDGRIHGWGYNSYLWSGSKWEIYFRLVSVNPCKPQDKIHKINNEKSYVKY